MNQLAVDIGANFNSPIGKTVGVGGLVSIILANAIVLAGVIMVIFMVVGGIMIIASAGQDDPQKAAQGKKAVTAGVVGFIIIFASYWIVQIVEIMTGLNILSPSGL